MGHFRIPFQKEKNVTPHNSSLKAKILFFVILAIVLYVVFSGLVNL